VPKKNFEMNSETIFINIQINLSFFLIVYNIINIFAALVPMINELLKYPNE
jgi:hypothetical protein